MINNVGYKKSAKYRTSLIQSDYGAADLARLYATRFEESQRCERPG